MRILERARREFLHECDLVVKIPNFYFLEGHDFTTVSTFIPLPWYVYVGIKENRNGNKIEAKILDARTHIGTGELDPSLMIEAPDNTIKGLEATFLKTKNYGELDANKEITKRLNKYKLKIWFETPFVGKFPLFNFCEECAFVLLLYYLVHSKSISEINKNIERYIDTFRIPGEIPFDTLSDNPYHETKITEHTFSFPSGDKKIDRGYGGREFWQIFRAFTSLETSSSPSLFFGTLLANKGVKKKYGNYETLKDIGSLSIYNKIQPAERKENSSRYAIKFSFTRNFTKGSSMLLVHWKGHEEKLFGSLLSPLFFQYKCFQKLRFKTLEKTYIASWEKDTRYIRSFWYDSNVLGIIAPYANLQKIREKIIDSGNGKICYDSTYMKWKVEGARLLEEAEYKLPESVQISEEKETQPKEKPIKEQPVEIDFYENEIRITPEGILDKLAKMEKPKGKPLPWQLLEYLVRKEKIHWFYSFIIFRESKTKSAHPTIKIFQKSISKIKRCLREIAPDITIEREGNHWKLMGFEEPRYKSNITESKRVYEEAKFSYEAKEFGKAKEKLREIVINKNYPGYTPSYYPNYLEAHILIVKCHLEENFKNVSKELIITRKYLENKQRVYENAINSITDVERLEYIEYSGVLSEIQKELEEIKYCNIALDKYFGGKPASKEDLEEQKEKEEINKIAELARKVQLGDEKGLSAENENFNSLCKIIGQKIFAKIAGFTVEENQKIEEKIIEIMGNFFMMIKQDKISFDNFPNVKSLRSYLLKAMGHRSESDLTDKRRLREMNQVWKEIAQEKKREPVEGEVYKKLHKCGWSKKLWRRILAYRKSENLFYLGSRDIGKDQKGKIYISKGEDDEIEY